MSDVKESEEQASAAARTPRKGRKGLLLGGGVLALIASGWAVALVATPDRPRGAAFAGPFVVALSSEDLQVNLLGEGGKRFLVMTLQAEYDAYDEGYALARVADPLYQAKLQDALIRVARQRTKADLDDPVGEELFKEEVRAAIEPLLFPLHVGDPHDANAAHEESGLRPGRSAERSTLRSGFHEHVLHVDAAARTLRLGQGPELRFEGGEEDLLLEDERGRTVWVDVSRLEPDFAGLVPVGTFGRVRKVYFGKLLVQ